MAKTAAVDAENFKAMERRRWQQAAKEQGESLGYPTSLANEPLLDAAGAGAGMRVLDACCGVGSLAAAAARRGAAVLAMDFAGYMVALAGRLHPGLEVREGDAEALPFADASFDAVLAAFGIRHLPRPESFLAGAYRVLAPGGQLAFTDWHPPSDTRESLFRIVRDAVRAHGDPALKPTIPAPTHDFSDASTSRRLVEAAGFDDWESMDLPMLARWSDADAVLTYIDNNMARTRELVVAQTADARSRIEQAILAGVQGLATPGGVAVPMPAVLVRARKP